MTFWRPTRRDMLNVQGISASMIAGIAFAVGLVLGVSGFLIPYAVSNKGKLGDVKIASSSSTSGTASSSASLPAPAPSAPGQNDKGNNDKSNDKSNTVTATNEAPAATDTAAGCDRQAWPYVTQECRDKIADGNRQVRVVTTDTNAPPTIDSPQPIVAPKPPAAEQAQKPLALPAANAPAQTAAANPAPAPQAPTAQVAPAEVQQTPPQPSQQVPQLQQAVQQVQPQTAAAGPVPATATQNPPEFQRPAMRDRKARERRTGKMLERTIEFADGRRVTITHPIGKGGRAAAQEALDRAAERELASQEQEGRRERSAEPRAVEPQLTRRIDTRQRSSEPEGRREKAWYEPDDDEPKLETRSESRRRSVADDEPRFETRRRSVVVETRRPREREWYEPD
jgi:hypothetical protein